MNDVITIALPVYKRTDFIRSALDSAVNQTVNCKIMIVDNNSPHNEFEKLVNSYEQADIKYIKNKETFSPEENFNICFQHVETPWVTILHDDDILHHQYVEFCRELLNRYGSSMGGIMFKTHVGEKEWSGIGTRKPLTREIKKLRPSYFHFFNTPFPGVLVKRDEAIRIGGFNKDFHPSSDLDFWYRYSKDNNFYLVAQEMSYFRISSTQLTSQFTDSMINNTYEYRLKEIENSAHNNILARLGLELSRMNNIKYFENTYSDFELPRHLSNAASMDRASSLMENKLLKGLVTRYIHHLSYSKA